MMTLMTLKHLASLQLENNEEAILSGSFKKKYGSYTELDIDSWCLSSPSSFQGRQLDIGTPYNLSEPVSNCFHCQELQCLCC
jgi:hypothetical protein